MLKHVTALLLTSTAALAEVPAVAVDIPPVHSLVSQVMGDLGTPHLVMTPGASPHDYAMRPSETTALAEANAVIWVGELIAPWLDRAIHNVSPDAASLQLLEVPGTQMLAFRDKIEFDDHEDHDHADHSEDKHDDHAHGEEAHVYAHAHDEHDHEDHAEADAHDDHAHDHTGTDPHAWLDPVNAQAWLTAIADALSKADPDNAATYNANAQAGRAAIDTLITETTAKMAPY